MLNFAAWSLFVLGLAHIPFGIFKFRAPLTEALGEGLIGRFQPQESRLAGLWFTALGPMFMVAGYVAIQAVAANDLSLLTAIGIYVFVVSITCVVAVPKSGFWVTLLISALLIAESSWLLF